MVLIASVPNLCILFTFRSCAMLSLMQYRLYACGSLLSLTSYQRVMFNVHFNFRCVCILLSDIRIIVLKAQSNFTVYILYFFWVLVSEI